VDYEILTNCATARAGVCIGLGGIGRTVMSDFEASSDAASCLAEVRFVPGTETGRSGNYADNLRNLLKQWAILHHIHACPHAARI